MIKWDTREDPRDAATQLKLFDIWVFLEEISHGPAVEGVPDGNVALGRVDEDGAYDARASGGEVVSGAKPVQSASGGVADYQVLFFHHHLVLRVPGRNESLSGGQRERLRAEGVEVLMIGSAGPGHGEQQIFQSLIVSLHIVGLDEPVLRSRLCFAAC